MLLILFIIYNCPILSTSSSYKVKIRDGESPQKKGYQQGCGYVKNIRKKCSSIIGTVPSTNTPHAPLNLPPDQ